MKNSSFNSASSNTYRSKMFRASDVESTQHKKNLCELFEKEKCKKCRVEERERNKSGKD